MSLNSSAASLRSFSQAPREVRAAVALIVASLLVAVLALVLAVTVLAGLAEDTTGLVGGLVFVLVGGVVVEGVLAALIAEGRNGARLLYAALTVLFVLGSLRAPGVTADAPVVFDLLSWLSLLCTVAAAVLTFVPGARPWFQR